MTIDEFSNALNTIWDAKLRANQSENIAIPALGLVGEAGEVSEHFKKHIRDGAPIAGNIELAKELGDVLHYWCRLTKLAGFTPAEIMRINEEKLAKRRAEKSAQRAADDMRIATAHHPQSVLSDILDRDVCYRRGWDE